MLNTVAKWSGLAKVCDQNGDRLSKNDRSCHICSMIQKNVFFARHEKYEMMSINDGNEQLF